MPLPEMAKRIGINSVLGGWLIALSDRLKNDPTIELVYCFPQKRTSVLLYKKMDNIVYYGFPERLESNKYNSKLESTFFDIYEKEKPDVIHIFGTEYPHTLAVIQSGIDLKKIVISIQGLVSIIAQHYCVGIPFADQIFPCFDSKNGIRAIYKEKYEFIIKGKREQKVLKKGVNFEGRTDFDHANICIQNPKAKYFKCNRILRQIFYKHQWELDKCERNTIFLSQASYPVKGFHIFLEALYMVKKMGIQVKVYIGGTNILTAPYNSSDPYAIYIKKTVNKYNLKNDIVFLGSLNEEKICAQYLKAHVFVSASVIENAPNSLGEAMILGVPSIASDVGGVSNMLLHEVEGYIYRVDAPYLLAYYLYRIMTDDKLAVKFSKNGHERAKKTYDIDTNVESVMDMYKAIMTEG